MAENEWRPEGYRSIKDTMAAWGISRKTVYDWIKCGKVTPRKVGGRVYIPIGPRPKYLRMRPVAKLDPVTGEVIATYRSETEAAQKHFISPWCIGKACREDCKISAGFRWKFIETEEEHEET